MTKETQRLIDRAKAAPRLPSELEMELIRAWQSAGDRRAADRVVEANMHLVVFAALKFRRYGIPIDDLVSEGSVGLMKALARFDSGKGARFSTYAAYWIRAQIVGLLIDSWSLLSGHSGALHSRMFFRLRRERAKVEALQGTDNVAVTLAKNFGVTHHRMDEMLAQLDSRELSLDVTYHDSDKTLIDGLAGEHNQELDLEREQLKRWLERALGRAFERLNPRERHILQRRILADAEDAESLAEIGDRFGVSRERARQIEERTISKVKQELMQEIAGSRSTLEFAA